MPERAQVFIGDLLRSLNALGISSVPTAREVMRMLSLEDWNEIVATKPAVPGTDATARSGPSAPAPDAAALAFQAALSAANTDLVQHTLLGAGESVHITRLPKSDPPPLPVWLTAVAPLPRPVKASTLPPEPLLDPRQERALHGGLAASLLPEGGIDIERLAVVMASGHWPRELPRRLQWSTRHGLQVLVDEGPGMAPFRQDVERTLARLAALMPDDRVARLSFVGCPTRGCRLQGRRGLRPWRPPAAGSGVLVLSDLGIAQAEPFSARGTDAEWLRFAAQARVAGVQLRALVPYPSSRWPAVLANPLHPVVWDRRTTVDKVRKAVAASARQCIA